MVNLVRLAWKFILHGSFVSIIINARQHAATSPSCLVGSLLCDHTSWLNAVNFGFTSTSLGGGTGQHSSVHMTTPCRTHIVCHMSLGGGSGQHSSVHIVHMTAPRLRLVHLAPGQR
jgi:hypothetical protein